MEWGGNEDLNWLFFFFNLRTNCPITLYWMTLLKKLSIKQVTSLICAFSPLVYTSGIIIRKVFFKEGRFHIYLELGGYAKKNLVLLGPRSLPCNLHLTMLLLSVVWVAQGLRRRRASANDFSSISTVLLRGRTGKKNVISFYRWSQANLHDSLGVISAFQSDSSLFYIILSVILVVFLILFYSDVFIFETSSLVG